MGAIAVMEPTVLNVAPGGTESHTVRITNAGSIVDQFVLDVVGVIGGWITVEPAVLNLLPGDEGVATVTFAPPRGSEVLAGEVAYAVRVMSREDTAGSVVQEGTVTVLPFAEVAAEIVPRTSRGRRRGVHEVAIDNLGNVPFGVGLLATDPDNALRFRCDPAAVLTDPGTATFVRITAKPVKRFLRGPDERLPFQVLISPDAAPSVTVEAALLQKALIPKGVLLAAGLVVAGVAVLAVLWQTLLKPSIQSTASDAAVAAASKENSAAGSSVASAKSQAAQAQSQASQAQAAAQSASSTVAKAVASASGGGLVGGAGIAGGSPTDFRLAANAPANTAGTFAVSSYQPPPKKSVAVSDLILQNPLGDQGLLQIRRNKELLIEVSLANFRDLDYHFVVPLAFTAKDQVILAVDCTNPGAKACTPAAYFSGQISK